MLYEKYSLMLKFKGTPFIGRKRCLGKFKNLAYKLPTEAKIQHTN